MQLRQLLHAGVAFSGLVLSNARLLTVPTTPFDESNGQYSLSQLKSIIVDSKHADSVDKNGQTFIPPTLRQFAETFQEDLKSAVGVDVSLHRGAEAKPDSIFITVDSNSSSFVDAAGRSTSEGYKLDISDKGVKISGASPLGAWWGTRSLIQTAVVGRLDVPQGSGVDAPGWGSRGAFLDAGRHFYPAEFLIEMCSYLSFFKQNIFHVHLSDNLIYTPGHYSREEMLNLYAAFRLWSDDPAVAGLNKRRNESYTREQFDNIQHQCARRGVTVIPEIETPGHALVFSQWKPEIGLDDLSMLNVSQKETIPTIETVWKTFLPWFHSKTVHIGADEYDSNHIDDYTEFVNAMNGFIRKESPVDMRIWGTFTPSQGCNVSKDVSYQHWEFFADNPYWDYVRNGYNVLNSDDTFYMVGKWSESYPQTLNKTAVFHGNPAGGGGFAPFVFDPNNVTNNAQPDNPKILGHVAALWNDYGPNATTCLEAYYQFRNVLPALGDKQWGGDIGEKEYDSIFSKLHAAIPGQNLDRRVKSKSDTILKYTFKNTSEDTVKDSSGNGYDGTLHGCTVKDSAVHFENGCYIETPLSSKGRDYTLSFSVKPTSNTPGTLFDGLDSTLLNGNGTISNVTFVSGGNPYSLNYSLPLNAWTDVNVKGKGDHTYFQVGESKPMEFLTRIGVNGESLVWDKIGIEAPLATIGKGFTGQMKNIELRDG